MYAKFLSAVGFFGMLAISGQVMAAGYGETSTGSGCQTKSGSQSISSSTGAISNTSSSSSLTVVCPLDQAFYAKFLTVGAGVVNRNSKGTACTIYAMSLLGKVGNYKKVTLSQTSSSVKQLIIQNVPVAYYSFLRCVLPPKVGSNLSAIYWYDFWQQW